MTKGIIFDFNGTLLWDSALHERAWNEMSSKLTGRPFTDREMKENVHGMTNGEIVRFLLGENTDNETIFRISNEKEFAYRKLCTELGKNFQLAPGAEVFLNSLKTNNVPIAIATSCSWDNVEFYLETFSLAKWFRAENIIYSNGTYRGKPAPDIYLLALKSLQLNAEDCIVIEDSVPGISAASAAGIGKIISINEKNDFSEIKNIDLCSYTIRDFNDERLIAEFFSPTA